MTIERTLIVLKPDAVMRGIVGEIITRFERIGLKIVGMKMVNPSEDHFHKHYEGIGQVISRVSEKVYNNLLVYMNAGPVVAVVLEGVEAVEVVRKMVGSTEPKSSTPGTIRGDYAHTSRAHSDANDKSIFNIIHASGNSEEAKKEIELWFKNEEIHTYKLAHEQLIA